jgi:hypothetical protein
MKLQLLFVALLTFIIFYDGYFKGPLLMTYEYGKLALSGAVLGYLIYTFYKSPADFYTALEFVKGHLTRSEGGAYKHLDRILEGKPKLARQVSPLLKKKVAAAQAWRCGHCKEILDASYEVDHIIALFKGGTNDEKNLIALCRNCHGKKTVIERLHPYRL